MEIRLLMRLLSVASVVLVILSIFFDNLLYIIALLLGIGALAVYKYAKPKDVKPYFYIALAGTIGAAITFLIEGVLGFVLFINS